MDERSHHRHIILPLGVGKKNSSPLFPHSNADLLLSFIYKDQFPSPLLALFIPGATTKSLSSPPITSAITQHCAPLLVLCVLRGGKRKRMTTMMIAAQREGKKGMDEMDLSPPLLSPNRSGFRGISRFAPLSSITSLLPLQSFWIPPFPRPWQRDGARSLHVSGGCVLRFGAVPQ